MTRETSYDKASRLLAEARVTIESVNRKRVYAAVRGTDRIHRVSGTPKAGTAPAKRSDRPAAAYKPCNASSVSHPPKER